MTISNKIRPFFWHFLPGFHEEIVCKRKKGDWGDHVDIVAMSELYNVPVKIFELNLEAKSLIETWIMIEELTEKGFSLPTVILCRHREKHYNAIIPTNSKVPLSMSQRNGKHIRKIRESRERMKKKSIKEDDKVEEAKDEQHTSTSIVLDKARIRPLGEAIPESEVEKLKREELAMPKEMLKAEGYRVDVVDEDGNCFYRALAHKIYASKTNTALQVRNQLS